MANKTCLFLHDIYCAKCIAITEKEHIDSQWFKKVLEVKRKVTCLPQIGSLYHKVGGWLELKNIICGGIDLLISIIDY